MRTFLLSAFVIASFLIAQQWMAKATEANSHLAPALAWAATATQPGVAR